jgi:hypothetical protein
MWLQPIHTQRLGNRINALRPGYGERSIVMAINIFEGGRRIAYLLMMVWAVGWALLVFVFHDGWPAVDARFEVRSPGQTPIRVTTLSCDADSRRLWDFDGMTPKGTKYNLELCFVATAFPDGNLVPFRRDPDGTLWGGSSYSAEVESYINTALRKWQPTEEDLAWIDSRKWSVRYEQITEMVPWLLGGVFVIWLLATILGWIVRGFMGIPAGRDRRAE